MYRFFANQRYVRLFFDIEKRNLSELSKTHGTLTHLSNVTDQWVREGLIQKERKGREIQIHLTKDGKEWLEILKSLDAFAHKQMEKIKKKGEKDNEGENKVVSSS